MKYLSATFVFFAGMLVHWLWSTYFTAYGLAPQVLLVLTVAISARSGPVPGQCYGFAWGLFLDVLSVHTFGANALGLTLAAYFIGMLRRQVDVASPPSQLVLVALLTPCFFLFHGFAGWIFERHFLWVGWKPFLVDPIYNCLVVPVGFAFTQKFIDL